jgi:wyosine [tRNA(Phe)-imidazoG37] synthetase (radical SAM superfamily)
MIAFGPVPSRRLGKSLGINNIPYKNCSYSCVYCQVGKTLEFKYIRKEYYKPGDIFGDVQELMVKTRKCGENIDYFAFVPDGEPTLDINLGDEIDLLKLLGYKIAVISNGSLLSHKDVQNDLIRADYVSLKIDTTDKEIWHKINRPHNSLNLDKIIEGMIEFSQKYKGKLVTETMLVDNINTSTINIEDLSNFISHLKPYKAFLAIPTRPPAEKWVKAPDEKTINSIFQIFREKVENVEYLIGYEGNEFISSGDIEKDLLNISAVHPMRSDAVKYLLDKAEASWQIIDNLIFKEKLKEVEYQGNKFYMRYLSGNSRILSSEKKASIK